MVNTLSLTSGILPENLHFSNKNALFKFCEYLKTSPSNTEFLGVSNRWRINCVSYGLMAVCCQKLS